MAAIECEICLRWFHLTCTSLVISDMKAIKMVGIHWYCASCNDPMKTFGSKMSRPRLEDSVVVSMRKEVGEHYKELTSVKKGAFQEYKNEIEYKLNGFCGEVKEILLNCKELVSEVTAKWETYNKSYCEVAKKLESCTKELNVNF